MAIQVRKRTRSRKNNQEKNAAKKALLLKITTVLATLVWAIESTKSDQQHTLPITTQHAEIAMPAADQHKCGHGQCRQQAAPKRHIPGISISQPDQQCIETEHQHTDGRQLDSQTVVGDQCRRRSCHPTGLA
jgi:hypothetical protein